MTRRRTDHNQREVMAALRKMGATVHDTSAVGGGFPDLVAGLNGHTVLIEVKNGSRKWDYTPQQVAFHFEWMGSPVVTLASADDAVKFVKIVRDSTMNTSNA